MSNPTMVIHGGMRFAGASAEVANFELEELTSDPTDLGIGRMWVNVTEKKIKYVAALDENGQAEVLTVVNDQDFSAVVAELATKANAASTLAGYGILDAVPDNDERLNYNQIKVVSQSPGKNQYNSIAAALASITDASPTNLYQIQVLPGIYIEPTLVTQPYISIDGSGEEVTIVNANSPFIDLVKGATHAGISRLTLNGSTGVGKSLIVMDDVEASLTKVFRTMQVRFGSADTLVSCKAGYVTVTGATFGEEAVFRHGFIAANGDGRAARIAVRNGSTNGMTAPFPTTLFKADGTNAQILLMSAMARASTSLDPANYIGVGLHLRNGGRVRSVGTSLVGFQKGIWAENAGAAPIMECEGINLSSNAQDLVVDHPDTIGVFHGSATKAKVSINPAVTSLSVLYTDMQGHGLINVGPMFVGKTHDIVTDIEPLISRGLQIGLLDGGLLAPTTGLGFSVTAGKGYVRINNSLRTVTWGDQTLTAQAYASQYVYSNVNGILQTSTSVPEGFANVILGRILTGPSSILVIGSQGSLNIEEFQPNLDRFLKQALGPLYVSGSIVSENATTPRAIDVTAGHYFFSSDEQFPSAKVTPSMLVGFHAGGMPAIMGWATLGNTQYDNGLNLTPLSPGYFTKHVLYIGGGGDTASYMIEHGNGNYATVEEAIVAPLPPTIFPTDGTPSVAAIIVQQGNDNIVQILDVRPRVGFAAASSAASTRHGDLLGLSDDNHTQYLLASGARAMTGALSMAGNAITNVSTVGGVNLTALAARLLPNGVDPLATAGPNADLTAASVNGAGTNNSFSRSDHTHHITGFQVSSGELDSVSAVVSNGFVRRSIEGVWSASALVAADVPSLDYSKITTGKPTTLAGYGITNAIQANGNIVPGTATKVTYDTKGLVTSGGALLATDIPGLDYSKIITGKPTTIAGYGITDAVNVANVGVANGLATLDATGKLSLAQIPSSLMGAVVYQGLWNPVTNTPVLVDGVGTKGHYYKVSVAGTRAIDSNATWNVGDHIVFDGVVWDRLEGDSTEVSSVAGRVGAVVLSATDISGLAPSATADTTNAANITSGVLPATRLPAFTGDVTSPSGSGINTLATSGVVAGSYGSASSASTFTVDAKGRLTLAASVPIAASWGLITSKPTTLGGYGITDALVANAAISAGTGTKITYDAKGLIVSAGVLSASDVPNLDWAKINTGKPTSLGGYGITDAVISNGGIIAGSTVKPSYDSKGLITGGGVLVSADIPNLDYSKITTGKPTSIAGYGITDALTSNPAVIAATATKITYDAKGLVTASALLAATDIPSLDWSKIATGKPVTLAGYGITNAVVANATVTAATFPKVSYDAKGLVTGGATLVALDIPNLDYSKITTGKPTTLGGYGITDAVSMAFFTNPTIPGLAGMTPPSGTTAEREASPALGRFRYNSTLQIHEGYTPNGWESLSNKVMSVYTGNIGAVTGTSIIPYDSSTPQSTEGSQLWSQSVTPEFATSKFIIDFHTCFDVSNNNRNMTLTLWRATTLIGFVIGNVATAGRPQFLGLHIADVPGSTAPVTYSLRAGIDSSSTWYLGRGSVNSMGGANRISWSIQEVLQ